RAAALPVQVLVAKDHDPVVDPRALVGRPKSARMPEVEISRRGRCNASAIDHRRLVSRLILSWLPAGIVAHSSASRGNKAPRRKGKRAWGRSGPVTSSLELRVGRGVKLHTRSEERQSTFWPLMNADGR